MKLSDLTMKYAIPAFGIGVRWLKEELAAHGVSVRLTDTCLREIVLDAEATARMERASEQDADEPYAERFRREIADRAEFLRAWTRSDVRINASDPAIQRMSGIARKYALPRAWTLHVPMAANAQHPTPTYLNWASAS